MHVEREMIHRGLRLVAPHPGWQPMQVSPLVSPRAPTMDTINDREFWEEFLAIYRSFRCLWDRKCPQYSDRHCRDEACAALVDKCKERYPKATRDMVVKKIHSFRCSFMREMKKVKRSRNAGDENYVPNLWYYDQLSFIVDSYVPREGATVVDNPEESNSEESKGMKRIASFEGVKTSLYQSEGLQRSKRPKSSSWTPNQTGLFSEELIKMESPEPVELVHAPQFLEADVLQEPARRSGEHILDSEVNPEFPALDPQQEEHNLRMKTLIMKHQLKEQLWRREIQMREDEHTMKMRVYEAQLTYYQNALGCSRVHEPDTETLNV